MVAKPGITRIFLFPPRMGSSLLLCLHAPSSTSGPALCVLHWLLSPGAASNHWVGHTGPGMTIAFPGPPFAGQGRVGLHGKKHITVKF